VRGQEWDRCINRLCETHSLGGSEGILPPHFLRATYSKIGAQIFHTKDNDSQYWGLIMPEVTDSTPGWVVRDFWTQTQEVDKPAITDDVDKAMATSGIRNFRHYDYATKHVEIYQGRNVQRLSSGINLREPSSKEARDAQSLQQKVWSVDDPAFLYPHDLYHPEAGLATQLVAVDNDEVVGFLFGFYGHGKQWHGKDGFQQGPWVESQLMGVDESQRRRGIGRNLKLAQREKSLQEGLNVVHWTVDPLQFGNAFLNMNILGGVAAQHYRDYYVFRNELNKVAASRIGISWILDSPRVVEYSKGHRSNLDFDSLASDSATEIVTPVNVEDGKVKVFPTDSWQPEGDTILFEIPADWNRVQRDNLALAETWRNTSDDMFEKILSPDETQYAISGIVTNEEKGYLVIEKVDEDLGL